MKTVAALLLVALLGAGGYLAYRYLGPRPVVNAPVLVPTLEARKAVAVPAAKFTDITRAAGITFRHHTGAAGEKFLPETMGGGVAVLDYDGDGKPDLYFVNSCPWPGGAKDKPCGALYRNRGDGTFEDVTEAAGLAVSFYGVGACVGDFDNDGRPDLFVSGVGGDRLFHNRGRQAVRGRDGDGRRRRPRRLAGRRDGRAVPHARPAHPVRHVGHVPRLRRRRQARPVRVPVRHLVAADRPEHRRQRWSAAAGRTSSPKTWRAARTPCTATAGTAPSRT